MSISDRGRAVAMGLAGLVAGACQASVPAAATRAAPLVVATDLYPLAQVVAAIGGGEVTVIDPVPAGVDPRRWGPGRAGGIAGVGLTVTAGGGWDPAFGGASSRATTGAYTWLDPNRMAATVPVIAAAMERADPAAAPVYRLNAETVTAGLRSTAVDYSSTLAACRSSTIVTPDGAFAGVASGYGLTDRVADGPDAALAASVRAAGTRNVYTEGPGQGGGDAAVREVAAAAAVTPRTLDPMVEVPAGGYRAGTTYTTLLEGNLAALSAGLGCEDSTQ